MSILAEFKKFALRGNVVDLAIGIIIGASFGKIVSTFVEFVVMPPLGLLIGGVDFTDLAITLKAAEAGSPAVVLAYGKFIQTVFDFTIIAFAVFLVVKAMNAVQKKEAAKPAPTPEDILLLREIRDSLAPAKKASASKKPAKKPSRKK